MPEASGIVILRKEDVDQLFKTKDHQVDVGLGIYYLVYTRELYSRIEKVLSWPKISQEGNDYLIRKFVAFDQKHHPHVIAGGLWAMGMGFSSDNGLKTIRDEEGKVVGWEVALAPYTLMGDQEGE